MSKKFATDDYEIARRVYGNGVTWKFDNRRVSVIQEENGFAFQFKTLDRDSAPHANCRFDRGVLHTTTMRLSREAGELLMLSLAEMMGLMPVYDNNLIKKNCSIPADSKPLCGSFEPDNSTSSATKCKCGREKWEHPQSHIIGANAPQVGVCCRF